MVAISGALLLSRGVAGPGHIRFILRRHLRHDREREQEPGTGRDAIRPDGALDQDLAALCSDELVREVEPEPVPARRAFTLVQPEEGAEDVGLLLGGDARAAVGYGDRDGPWCTAGADLDRLPGRRITNGVLDEVPDDLLEQRLVG